MKEIVDQYVRSCDACQRYKNLNQPIGHLATKQIGNSLPWNEVAIDTIGPWKIKLPDGRIITLNAYTIIDTCTNLLECVRSRSNLGSHQTGLESIRAFDQGWLSRYPRPVSVIFDQGSEFYNVNFESHLIMNGIIPRPITSGNPQSNAILERSHSVIKTSMRTELAEHPPQDEEDAIELLERILASAQLATRMTVHKTMNTTPGAFAFNRDMLLPIPVINDIVLLRNRRQRRIHQDAQRETQRRRDWNYQVGDQVMILEKNPGPLEHRATGPHRIAQVHTNGTISYERKPNVLDRINIRRIKPYFGR